MPGPATNLGIRARLIDRHSQPEILVHGLVTVDDVKKLFELLVEGVFFFFPSFFFSDCGVFFLF
jgi:hypothetical protein